MINSRIRRFIKAGLAICVLMAAPQAMLRADTTGTILGTVRDATGAAMPSVTITVTNTETSLVQTGRSDTSGDYRFLALPVGTYRVEATQSGFRKYVADNVVLQVNQERRVDIDMSLGNLEQKVEVSANSVQVETTSTQLGTVINERAIVNLPLNGRSFIDLLSIQAGVAPTSSSTGNISVNGQREGSNAFYVNGGDVNDGRNFGTSVIPNLGFGGRVPPDHQRLRRRVRPVQRRGHERHHQVGDQRHSRFGVRVPAKQRTGCQGLLRRRGTRC